MARGAGTCSCNGNCRYCKCETVAASPKEITFDYTHSDGKVTEGLSEKDICDSPPVLDVFSVSQKESWKITEPEFTGPTSVFSTNLAGLMMKAAGAFASDTTYNKYAKTWGQIATGELIKNEKAHEDKVGQTDSDAKAWATSPMTSTLGMQGTLGGLILGFYAYDTLPATSTLTKLPGVDINQFAQVIAGAYGAILGSGPFGTPATKVENIVGAELMALVATGQTSNPVLAAAGRTCLPACLPWLTSAVPCARPLCLPLRWLGTFGHCAVHLGVLGALVCTLARNLRLSPSLPLSPLSSVLRCLPHHVPFQPCHFLILLLVLFLLCCVISLQ